MTNRAVQNPDGVQCVAVESSIAPVHVEMARFRGATGVEELHLMAWPTRYGRFEDQLDWLSGAVHGVLDDHGIGHESVIHRRFFCSDLANQLHVLRGSGFAEPRVGGDVFAASWIGQSPPVPAKVALSAQHVIDPSGPLDKALDGSTLLVRRSELTHLWSVGLNGLPHTSAAEQTTALLGEYDALLRRHGLTLADHVVRTWLYVRDIDVDYMGMAVARRQLFMQRGLTPATHYIASTGIEGAGASPAALVSMDACAIAGLRPEQVTFIRAPQQLSATDAYGVTFERATTIAYADRRHVLISGTASIDEQGHTLHVGHVARQLERTLDNIEALLCEADTSRAHLTHLIAYLRDPSDEAVVRSRVRERLGDVPLIVVRGAVCRPEWLVEIEGQAIASAAHPALPRF